MENWSWASIACAIAVAFGSVGPWLNIAGPLVGAIGVGGIHGYGRITIIAAIAAAALHLIAIGSNSAIAAYLGAACLAVVGGIGGFAILIFSSADFRGQAGIGIDSVLGDDHADSALMIASVGWGLELLTFAAVIGTFTSIIAGLLQQRAHLLDSLE